MSSLLRGERERESLRSRLKLGMVLHLQDKLFYYFPLLRSVSARIHFSFPVKFVKDLANSNLLLLDLPFRHLLLAISNSRYFEQFFRYLRVFEIAGFNCKCKNVSVWLLWTCNELKGSSIWSMRNTQT